MLAGTERSYAADFPPSCRGGRQALRGANNSFILSGQEMNHRCNLISVCHNLAVCVTALCSLRLHSAGWLVKKKADCDFGASDFLRWDCIGPAAPAWECVCVCVGAQ